MSNWLARIVLGTAQFGLPYGRLRETGTLSESAAVDALEAAWALGIRAFDTSEAYGLSAGRLATWLRATNRIRSASVVTKVLTKDITDRGAVQAAAARFADAASLTVLSHGAANGSAWAAFATEVLELGVSAGQSVYSADEVTRAAKLGAARVQIPANVLDSRQLDAAHAASIPADIRSVYLQGVLLDAPELAERRARGAGALAAAVQRAAADEGVAASRLLLASMLAQLSTADRVLVGVDTAAQLRDIELAIDLPLNLVHSFLARLDGVRAVARGAPAVLDPRSWS